MKDNVIDMKQWEFEHNRGADYMRALARLDEIEEMWLNEHCPEYSIDKRFED